MNWRRGILILAMTFCLVACSSPEPSVILHDQHSNPVDLSELKGKWVIVNYWASWCESCAWEVPHLNKFYQNNKNKNIVLYGVSYDPLPQDELSVAVNKMHIQFPVLLENPSALWQLGDTDVVPVTYIINPEGKVAQKIVGPTTEESLSAVMLALQK